MALGVRLKGLPATGDDPLWSMEAPWWREAELCDDPRFKDASWCPGYADYEAVVTLDEAKTLASRYASRGATFDHWKKPMKKLDRKLANHDGRLDRVQIRVFEWESGF